MFFFVSTVLNFASTVLNFASTVFFFVSTVLNFASTVFFFVSIVLNHRQGGVRSYVTLAPPSPPNSMHPCIPDYSGGEGGGRKSPSNKPPPPPSSIPPHIQLIGRNNKQQHTRTPNNRQQHTTTVDNSTLVDKNTNVPLFKKLFDIIFFGGENHFMSHFSGHFEGASTFLTPKLSLAALGTI